MMQLENGTWVLVLDGSKALILENITDGQDPNLRVVRKEENEAPDNKGESTTGPAQQGIRRQLDASDYHELTEQGFAEEMAEWLYKAAHRGRFRQIVLVAPDKVIGTLRQKLHKEVADKVVGEVHKTLTGHPVDQIERIVAQELATS
ncbi:host attachment family protein [Rubellimicrobium roseum]|uniref:Host attachment protein n=1 Tax=Rubellimicrobium roseum TaxID=687525 RepID=A0A5C4NM19_9RHOB|nr:host attachment family protein [Rubellimicrobium roseum]TNC73459.1 host attachment protein [Rubellimicrobium roseum]